MKTTALIEKGKDGTFSIYTPDIDATIIGLGDTVAEAKADFANSVNELKQISKEEGVFDGLEDITFDFKYDTASVFNEFDCINITKFAKRAGIYPSSLRQHAQKLTYISENQANKIESALNSLGDELKAISL